MPHKNNLGMRESSFMGVVVLVGGGRHNGWHAFATHLPRWPRVLIVDRGKARVRGGWNARLNLFRHGVFYTHIVRDLSLAPRVDGVWFCGGQMDELLPLVAERAQLRHVQVIGGSSAGARLLGRHVNEHRDGMGIIPGCVGVHGHCPCRRTTLHLRAGEVRLMPVPETTFFSASGRVALTL
jgi:hypothetical protein